jgi:hypothetical protein
MRCYLLRKEVESLQEQLKAAMTRIARMERTETRLRLRIPIKKKTMEMACQTTIESMEMACQTTTEAEKGRWTDTGTLIDDDNHSWACGSSRYGDEASSCSDNEMDEDVETETETVCIAYREEDNDIRYDMGDACRHFNGAGADPNLYVGTRLSLARLREKYDSLSFPYTEEEIEEQARLHFLVRFLEQREPFCRRIVLDEAYAFEDCFHDEQRWCRRRVFCFTFCGESTTV